MSALPQTRDKRMHGTNFRDSKGIYTWKNERYPSVTTILKMKDKPALPRWASKSVAEFVKGEAERRNRGEITGAQLMETILDVDRMKSAPWNYAEKKRDMGSTFHDVAEQITLGTPVSPAAFGDDVRGYIESFLLWLETWKPEFEASEFACFNRSVGYAGTCDALVRLNGRLVAFDFKTGADSYDEHALQLSAYRHAEFIGLQDGTEEPMPETDGGCILLPQPDGSIAKLLEWPTGEAEFRSFSALKTIYDWAQTKPKYQEVSLCLF